jgi:putative glutathione S-transferase
MVLMFTSTRTRPDDPEDQHCGWWFKKPDDPPVTNPLGYGSYDCEGCIPDTVNGASTLRELYEKSDDKTGKYSVPVLWDKKLSKVVNNESAEIMLMFNNQFNQWATVVLLFLNSNRSECRIRYLPL